MRLVLNKVDNRLKWIDNNKNKTLRTNNSFDDLVFKDQPEPVQTHRSQVAIRPIIKTNPTQNDPNGLKLNFYIGGENLDADGTLDGFEPQSTVEGIPRTNTISENTNYDPMMGNAALGHTMPLPQKNNLLNVNKKQDKIDAEMDCKKFINKIKQGDGMQHKKPVRDKNKRAYNYITGMLTFNLIILYRKQA